jgi:CheY-like chemotaxis protein
MATAAPAPEADGYVLLVDDDDDTREVLAEVLGSAGYRSHGARSGAEAMQLLDALGAPPRLVFVDVVMPGMSGLEWIDLARKRPELDETHLVVLSGTAPPASGDWPQGVEAWMMKPARIDKLLEMVARMFHAPKGRPRDPTST